MSRTRPTPLQWVAYSFGRKLPDHLQDWVRRDLTGSHAFTRHLLRSEAPYVPIFVAFMFLPGALWLRLCTALLAVLLSVFYSIVYLPQNRARRLELHGLPGDLQPAKAQRRRDIEHRAYEMTYRDEPESDDPRTGS